MHKFIPLGTYQIGTVVPVEFDERTAKTFLLANTENRNLNAAELRQYVWDMQNDAFDYGAVPICVCPSKDGKGLILADGQTRLHAMLQAKKFGTCFVRAITREQRHFLNGGRRNTFRDRQKMGAAIADCGTDELVVRTFIRFVEDGMLTGKDYISDARVKGTYDQHTEFLRKMRTGRKFQAEYDRKIPHSVFVATLEVFIADNSKEQKLIEFLDRLACPNFQDRKPPETLYKAVTQFMDHPKRATGHGRASSVYLATKAALIAWLRNRAISVTKLNAILYGDK